MPRYADFPRQEFEQRYARARKLMDEQALDALLITHEHNYFYFSGHRSQQNIIDKIRPYIFLLPRQGEPTLITMPFEVQQVRDTTWVENIRTAGLDERTGPIVRALKESGLERARIGMELGREQYLGISYSEFGEIQAALPNARFLDASAILLKLRATKSPREIELIRKAGQIMSEAMAETFADTRSGMTELEVMRILRRSIAEKGGENVTFMWVVTSQDGMIANPTARRLEPGNLLVLDAGVEYRGYASDVSRSAVVGEPSKELDEFYTWMSGLVRISVDQLRAGSTPREVLAACRAECAARGLTAAISGRIGHGVGLESTEYPSLVAHEDVVFEPGMVFACNPNFFYEDYGWLNNEDNWAVTEKGGPELLSAPRGPDRLTIIPA